MTDQTTEPEDLGILYRRAFKDYGSRALWNMQAIEDPTPADALAITRALRTHGGMDGRRLAEQIERLCRASTKLQSHVLRVLAAERSPDSYIAGGVAINREGPRFSRDIDIFQDSQQRLETAAAADTKALTEAGLKLSWKKIGAANGKRRSKVLTTR